MRAFKFVSLMAIGALALLLVGCSALRGSGGSFAARQDGAASYYADRYHGRTTANGEIFNVNKLTAAHRTLPFGTHVRVVNLNNGKSVTVRINDRGPYVEGRIIDLSPAAARKIDMIETGVVPVQLEVLRGEATARAE